MAAQAKRFDERSVAEFNEPHIPERRHPSQGYPLALEGRNMAGDLTLKQLGLVIDVLLDLSLATALG
jgi:hypothetical protein